MSRLSGPGIRKQPLFNIGDYVERFGTMVPEDMRFGHIVRVIPHNDTPEQMTEYEVRFKYVVATFPESQLRSADEPFPS